MVKKSEEPDAPRPFLRKELLQSISQQMWY
jgi:hypothetical protein